MEIRFAQAKDIPGILALLRQVGQVHHEGRPDIFRSGAQKYGASQILSMMESSATPIFSAEVDAPPQAVRPKSIATTRSHVNRFLTFIFCSSFSVYSVTMTIP